MKKATKVVREIKVRRRFIVLMLFSFIFSLLFVVFSFVPCLKVTNITTSQTNPFILGVYLAAGHLDSDPFIKGNTLSLVFYIIAAFGFLFIGIFTIWTLKSKSANRFKYILLALSVFSTAAGVFFCSTMPSLFKNFNSVYQTDFYNVTYTVFGYLSLIFEILSLLVNLIAMFYIAAKTQKRNVIVEKK